MYVCVVCVWSLLLLLPCVCVCMVDLFGIVSSVGNSVPHHCSFAFSFPQSKHNHNYCRNEGAPSKARKRHNNQTKTQKQYATRERRQATQEEMGKTPSCVVWSVMLAVLVSVFSPLAPEKSLHVEPRIRTGSKQVMTIGRSRWSCVKCCFECFMFYVYDPNARTRETNEKCFEKC